MFRTRDFILFFVTIVFLVMAIGATLWNKLSEDRVNTSDLPQLSAVSDVDYAAEVVVGNVLSRADKLAEMRQKISESQDVYIGNGVLDEDLVNGNEVAIEDTAPIESVGLSNCPAVIPYLGIWPTLEVKSKLTEGSRVFYREEMVNVVVASSTGTTTELITASQIQETPLLQLPINPTFSAQANCITSSVIGVAKEGSLIRNNESGLYGVFGEETLIGYALDGWPIYGTSDRELDLCGGAAGPTGYGYYLSPDQTQVLNCFVSNPTSI
jgi:hypothetical protein